MTRAEAWFTHASALLVGGTGLVYGWMRYCVEPADELALVHHPLEPTLQAAHILLAPLLVFAGGLLWREHIWGRLRAGASPRRPTGVLLLALLAPMVASGYLVQTTTSDLGRELSVWVHATSGAVWALGYGIHLLAPRRRGAS
jgi:hypothetical protein